MITGIYCIRNSVTNKCYIGSAINIEQRWRGHRSRLNRGCHHSILLQRAFDKYGSGAFNFTVLEVCERDGLLRLEQEYLNRLTPAYNVCKIAGAPMTGRKHTAESKEKIARSATGRKCPCSEETKIKIATSKQGCASAFKGRSHTEQARRRMSEAHKGHEFSPERREALRKAQQSRRLREAEQKTGHF